MPVNCKIVHVFKTILIRLWFDVKFSYTKNYKFSRKLFAYMTLALKLLRLIFINSDSPNSAIRVFFNYHHIFHLASHIVVLEIHTKPRQFTTISKRPQLIRTAATHFKKCNAYQVNNNHRAVRFHAAMIAATTSALASQCILNCRYTILVYFK